jgi:hypothetical protein
MALLTFDAERSERLPPDEEKSGDIYSRLGYRITDAIADLVDNSVDAEASNVHIRFLRSSEGIHSVTIADNGTGMTDSELKEAMRFGSRSNKRGNQLGKYGIGLKSASLSQAERVTVLARRGKDYVGRRWTLPNIKKGWQCEILRASDTAKAFNQRYGDVRITKSGTIVIWEELEHLQALPDNVDQVLERTTKELNTELGIRFHRFIQSNRLAISIDQQLLFEDAGDICTSVPPLDPFDYPTSPNKDYPARLSFKIGSVPIIAECHIWPPKSNLPGYRLGGGKVALRQGFYFYRNDRIIQAGGWNGLRGDDGEPHLSLARVKIDLPDALDSKFKLDVAKSRLDPAPEFRHALLSAKTRSGTTFDKFIIDAQNAYRKQKVKDRARFPVVPGSGFTTKSREAIAGILKEDGAERPFKISIRWEKLDHDEVVRPDPADRCLLLNSRFRSQLAEGGTNDAPVLKMALLFLLQEELLKTFATKVTSDWLRRVNAALIASLKS